MQSKLIGISLYGSNLTRTYPHMRKVGDLLQKKGHKILYLDERENGGYKYEMWQMAALIEQCDIIISSNTSAYHLAGAMKKRAVVIFGSCNGILWIQDYEKQTTAQLDNCPLGKIKQGKCWWDMRCLPGKDLREKEKTSAPACLAEVPVNLVISKVEEHFNVKKVLVVITTFNLLKLTKETMDSVRSFHNYDFLIVDNASTDGTVQWAKKNKIEIVSKSCSVAEAWNIGMETAYKREYDYVLVLNNDVILSPGYVDKVIEVMERRKPYMVTGKVINKWEGNETNFHDMVHAVEGPIVTMDAGDYSAMLISRKCIEDIGKFRKLGIRYQSDEDHLLRIRLSGGAFIKTWETTFFHKHGAVVKTIKEEHVKRKAQWKDGVEAFKKMWNIDPYVQRPELNSLPVVKTKNPDWKNKIKVPFEGINNG